MGGEAMATAQEPSELIAQFFGAYDSAEIRGSSVSGGSSGNPVTSFAMNYQTRAGGPVVQLVLMPVIDAGRPALSVTLGRPLEHL
jgi:hypothetical protein